MGFMDFLGSVAKNLNGEAERYSDYSEEHLCKIVSSTSSSAREISFAQFALKREYGYSEYDIKILYNSNR